MHHGILNINKPAGVTSRHVVDVVTRIAGMKQVGHAGTLDPLATGVLVICLGSTTRLVQYVQEQHKEYRAVFLLGKTSDTDDVSGNVVDVPVDSLPTRSDVQQCLQRFVGRILQVPPRFSAVHVGGRRAHQLARKGSVVEIPPREVDVFRIDIEDYQFPRLELTIECGSGTYIRSIGRDLGKLLGCGAVMSELVRTRIGEFRIESALPLEQLTHEMLADQLLPHRMAVSHLPQIACTEDDLQELRFGRMIPCREPSANFAVVPLAIIGPDGNLAALAEWKQEAQMLQPRQVYLPR